MPSILCRAECQGNGLRMKVSVGDKTHDMEIVWLDLERGLDFKTVEFCLLCQRSLSDRDDEMTDQILLVNNCLVSVATNRFRLSFVNIPMPMADWRTVVYTRHRKQALWHQCLFVSATVAKQLLHCHLQSFPKISLTYTCMGISLNGFSSSSSFV